MSSTIIGRSRIASRTCLALRVMLDSSGISISDDCRFRHGEQSRNAERRHAIQDCAGRATPAQRVAQTRGVDAVARRSGHGRMLALGVIELRLRLILADGTETVLARR